MSELRRSSFHRVLHRPNLILGGERELVMFTALMTAGLTIIGQNLVTTVICLIVWSISIVFLRMMAKADPLMSRVYLRQLRYRSYYPPRSRPFRTDQE